MDPSGHDVFSSWSSFEAYIKQSIPTLPDDAGVDGRANVGTICAVADYHSVYAADGKVVVVRGGGTSNTGNEKDEACFAIIRTTHWDVSGSKVTVQTRIRSLPMKKALMATVLIFRNHIDTEDIVFYDKPRQLFHCLEDIFNYGRELNAASENRRHIQFLVDYLRTEFSDAIGPYYSFVRSKCPSIDFPRVWTIFREEWLIYIPRVEYSGGVDMVVKLHSLSISCACDQPDHQFEHVWKLVGTYIDSAGNCLNHNSLTVSIPYFSGIAPIEDLCAVPFYRHSRKTLIRNELVERGRKFVQLRGQHYCQFRGPALLQVEASDMLQVPADSEQRMWNVDGRIMIDSTVQHRKWPSASAQSHAPLSTETLSDDDYLICSGVVWGYSFADARWGFFEVGRIESLKSDTNWFTRSLVINEKHKKILLSLVASENENAEEGNSVQQRSRSGVKIMLYGDSGVGKTMAAESIAEYSQRPLLRINAGDILKRKDCIDALTEYFDIAQRWRAVILLDEAELCVGTASPDDWRGKVFLKALLNILDWYNGIIFLTTSRIGSIDQAFQSRIQFRIHFPPPTLAGRRKLWLLFLSRSGTGKSESELEDMSSEFFVEELNGKQIGDVVRMAQALASGEGDVIRASHLREALNELRKFSEEVEKGRKAEAMKKRPLAQLSEKRLKRQRLLHSSREQDNEDSTSVPYW